MLKKITQSDKFYITKFNQMENPELRQPKDLKIKKGITYFTTSGTLDNLIVRSAKSSVIRLKPIYKLPPYTPNVMGTPPTFNKGDYIKNWRKSNSVVLAKPDSFTDKQITIVDLAPLDRYKFSSRIATSHKFSAIANELIKAVKQELSNTSNHCFIELPTTKIVNTDDYSRFATRVKLKKRQHNYSDREINQYWYSDFTRFAANYGSVYNTLSNKELSRVTFLFQTKKGVMAIPGLIASMLNESPKTYKGLLGDYFIGYKPNITAKSQSLIIKTLFGLGKNIEEANTEEVTHPAEDSEVSADIFDNMDDAAFDKMAKEREEQAELEKQEEKLVHLESVTNATLMVKTPIDKKKLPPKRLKDRINKSKLSVKKHKRALKLREISKEVKVHGVKIKGSKVGKKKLKPKKLKVEAHYKNEQYEPDTVHSAVNDYLDTTYNKHIARVFDKLNSLGFIISNVETKVVEDISGSKTIYKLKVNPIDGEPNTIEIVIPTIGKHGVFKVAGVDYVMKFQKGDRPIIKRDSSSVILSSYASKLIVTRDQFVHNNRDSFIVKTLITRSEDANSDLNVVLMSSYDGKVKLPKSVSGLASTFSKVQYKDLKLDLTEITEVDVSKSIKKDIKDKGDFYKVGVKGLVDVIVSRTTDKWYTYKGNSIVLLGNVVNVFDIDKKYNSNGEVIGKTRVPSDTAVVGLGSKRNIPVVIVLSQLIGLDNLIKELKAEVAFYTHDTFKNKDKSPENIYIYFKDLVLEVIKPTYMQGLVLNGLLRYPSTKELAYKEFHKTGKDNSAIPYIVSTSELSTMYRIGPTFVKEAINLYDFFIDPMTEDLLEDMKEPTEFVPLMLKAVFYLTDDSYPEVMDASNMVIRGYERIAGMIYKELTRSIALYRYQNNTGKRVLNHPSYSVWQAISTDTAKEPLSSINNIDALKQRSAVTLSGTGGRNARTLVGYSRRYTPADLGTIGGSTADSGKVGIVAHMSASPLLKDSLGNSKKLKDAQDNPAASATITELMSPGIEYDDMKRRNFANIHDSHQVGFEGSSPFVRGGYAPYLARRETPYDMFSIPAKGEGKVTKVTKDYVEVKYKGDKEPTRHSLVPVIGSSEGKHFKHKNEPNVEVGDKVRPSTLIAYNRKFFNKPAFEPDVVNNNALMVNVGLFENMGTWEDSCVISESTAKKIEVNMVKRRVIRFDGSSNIYNIKVVGDAVSPLDPLAVIVDSTVNAEGMSTEAQELLKIQMTDKPLAKYSGTIVNISVIYSCEKEELSPSVKKYVDDIEKYINKVRKASDPKAKRITGKVPRGYKLKGEVLSDLQVGVTIDIEVGMPTGNGDKVEFGYMFKSVISGTFPDNYTTSDGYSVDAMMSFRGFMDRITTSPFLLLAGSLLEQFADKRLLDIYNK